MERLKACRSLPRTLPDEGACSWSTDSPHQSVSLGGSQTVTVCATNLTESELALTLLAPSSLASTALSRVTFPSFSNNSPGQPGSTPPAGSDPRSPTQNPVTLPPQRRGGSLDESTASSNDFQSSSGYSRSALTEDNAVIGGGGEPLSLGTAKKMTRSATTRVTRVAVPPPTSDKVSPDIASSMAYFSFWQGVSIMLQVNQFKCLSRMYLAEIDMHCSAGIQIWKSSGPHMSRFVACSHLSGSGSHSRLHNRQ